MNKNCPISYQLYNKQLQKMMTILPNLEENVNKYLNGQIENPLLKKVIEEEITFSNNLIVTLKNFLSDSIQTDNLDKLDNLSILIDNLSIDTKNILKKQLIDSFVQLSKDEHVYIILNLNNNVKKMFTFMKNDPVISNILKFLITGLSIGISTDEYVIKCIDSCKLIDPQISDNVIHEYINNNSADIIGSDKLLSYIINYDIYHQNNNYNYTQDINNLLFVKLSSIDSYLQTLQLTNMDYAYEIYKLGKIIIDSKISFVNKYKLSILKINNEQLEYIVRSIHTCITNKNISQAQTILAIIYYLDMNDLNKFMEYYVKWFLLRINSDILSIEYQLWNINDQYKYIVNMAFCSNYMNIITNIRSTNIINNDLSKITIKNSDVSMSKVKVNLLTFRSDASTSETIVHHPNINKYIEGLDKYIKTIAPLQNIYHDINKSTMKIRTKYGSIKCTLSVGSIVMYLNDGDMTIQMLVDKIKLKDDVISTMINTLFLNNIVINYEKDGLTYYKYVEPYGEIECDDKIIAKKPETNIVIGRFTDIILTVESRIIHEIKPTKMNILELERRIQEFMGDDYVRNIFFQRVESLKKRFYIEDNNDILSYVL